MRHLNGAAALLAALSLASAAAAAEAPSPRGDWIGVIDSPTGPQRMGVRLLRGPDGGWQGIFDSLDQGSRNIPVANVIALRGELAFEVPAFQGRYQGQWDAAKNAWRGTFFQPQGSIALDFKRGPIPRAREVKGLDGDWEGVLPNGDNPQSIVVHVRTTTGDGTLATIDNLTTRVGGMPVARIERQGRKIRLQMAALNLSIEGALDARATTLTGEWVQDRQPTPVTLTRRATP